MEQFVWGVGAKWWRPDPCHPRSETQNRIFWRVLRQSRIYGAQPPWRKLPACDVRSQNVGKQDPYPTFQP